MKGVEGEDATQVEDRPSYIDMERTAAKESSLGDTAESCPDTGNRSAYGGLTEKEWYSRLRTVDVRPPAPSLV